MHSKGVENRKKYERTMVNTRLGSIVHEKAKKNQLLNMTNKK